MFAFILYVLLVMGECVRRNLTHILTTNYKNCLNHMSHTFSLKSIDLVCMKKLDTKVNIIPIIAKADTISKTELQKFKVCAAFPLFQHIYNVSYNCRINLYVPEQNHIRVAKQWNTHLSVSN